MRLSEIPVFVKEAIREGRARYAVDELLRTFELNPSLTFVEADAERLVFLESLAIAQRNRHKIIWART